MRTFIIAMMALGLALSGCSFAHSPKLVLVISIDGLKSEDINCKNMNQDVKNSFSILCHEFKSIEGLTAPTSSTAANLASLFSGLEPDQTRFKTNDDVLSSSLSTLAEIAHGNDWMTSLHAGSPSILRRSNLAQGFEYFDEHDTRHLDQGSMSFKSSLETFLKILNDYKSKAVFSVIGVGELLYPEIQTRTSTGDLRTATAESSLEEVNEQLTHLFTELHRLKRWDNTDIFILGDVSRIESGARNDLAFQVSPRRMLSPLFLKTGIHTVLNLNPEKNSHAIWSFLDLHNWLTQTINQGQSSKTNPVELSLTKSRDLLVVQGCQSQRGKKPVCRKALIGETAWIYWDQILKLDSKDKEKLVHLARQRGLSETDRWRPTSVKIKTDQELELADFETCSPNWSGSLVSRAPCPSAFYRLLLTSLALNESGDSDALRTQKLRLRKLNLYHRRGLQWLKKNYQLQLMSQLNQREVTENLFVEKLIQEPKLQSFLQSLD